MNVNIIVIHPKWYSMRFWQTVQRRIERLDASKITRKAG